MSDNIFSRPHYAADGQWPRYHGQPDSASSRSEYIQSITITIGGNVYFCYSELVERAQLPWVKFPLPTPDTAYIADAMLYMIAFADRLSELDREIYRAGGWKYLTFFRGSTSPSQHPLFVSGDDGTWLLRTFMMHLLVGYDALPGGMSAIVDNHSNTFAFLPLDATPGAQRVRAGPIARSLFEAPRVRWASFTVNAKRKQAMAAVGT